VASDKPEADRPDEAEPEGQRRSRPRRRGRGRRRSRRGGGDLARRFRRAEEELADLARAMYGDMFGRAFDHARDFALDLGFAVETDGTWRLGGRSLEEQVRRQVREMASHAEALRPGRVYCYRCESSDCEHSPPPGPTQVFAGYSSTGQPEWAELPQLLLDLGHERVEALYERPRELLAAALSGEELKARQLSVFGRESKSYDVLAQVVAGYLQLPGPPGDEEERVAFTVQAVEARRLDGRPWVDLNVIGTCSDGVPVLDLMDDAYLRLHRMISKTRRQVRALGVAGRGRGRTGGLDAGIGDKAAGLLLDLSRSIEQLSRQGGRRTRHAEARGREQRPTAKALEEALAAADHSLLWDSRDETMIVLGGRNRVHVYTLQGKQVTSLTLDADSVERRRRTGRWVEPGGERRAAFRENLERRT